MAAEADAATPPGPGPGLGAGRRQITAAVAAVASLGVTMLFVAQSNVERRANAAGARALVAEGAAGAPDAAAETVARSALWLDPLNQNALNTVYVRAFDRHEDAGRLARLRALLARLGWRSTSTQQNLLAAAVARQDVTEIMDRIDGLLRRNKFVTQSDAFIAAVESSPQTRAALVAKLSAVPPWRELLLMRGGELHGRARLAARAATMEALLDKGATLSRGEVAPFLAAAAAGGELQPAYHLWTRTLRVPTEGGLLYDGGFKVAAVQGVRPPLPVPFEWTFGNGDGYTTQIGSDGGLFVRWSGRGVPLLFSQPLRAPAGARGYRLHVKADRPSVPIIADKLALALTCGTEIAPFRPVALGPTSLDLVASPTSCAIPVFTVSGRLQDVAQPMTATVTGLRLDAQ